MSLNTYNFSSISRRRTCWENDLPAELIKDLKIPVDPCAKVADFLARDLQQFGSNLTAKLLAECELHLARERREFLEEVDACVEQKVLGGGLGESEIENEIILLVIIAKKITIDTFRENS